MPRKRQPLTIAVESENPEALLPAVSAALGLVVVGLRLAPAPEADRVDESEPPATDQAA